MKQPGKETSFLAGLLDTDCVKNAFFIVAAALQLRLATVLNYKGKGYV